MKFDLGKINATFNSLIPKHVDAQGEKANDLLSKLPALSGLFGNLGPLLAKAKQVDADFVRDWPQIRDTINIGLKMAGNAPHLAGAVGKAKAGLEIIDKNVIPVLDKLDGQS